MFIQLSSICPCFYKYSLGNFHLYIRFVLFNVIPVISGEGQAYIETKDTRRNVK